MRKSISELFHLLILVAIVMCMLAMGNHLILGTYIQEVSDRVTWQHAWQIMI
jgi:hypothetical protein